MPDTPYADLTEHKAAIDATVTNVTATRGITKANDGQLRRNEAETLWEHINDMDIHSLAGLTAHEADTSNVHGIADTTALETTSGATSKVSTHAAVTTSVHGIADTSALETTTGATTKVSDHAAVTTSVHGIADTSALETTSGATSKVSTHAAVTTSVHGIADTSVLETTTGATNKVSTHSALTTSIHGIADTSLLLTSAESSVILDVVSDIEDTDAPIVYTRGLNDTTDGGGGWWQLIGSNYSASAVNTITDRFALDYITTTEGDGSKRLYKRLESILVPEMWGVMNRSASDTDQAALIQRMFNLACYAVGQKSHQIYFPPGEYRIESTIQCYVESGGNTLPPRVDIKMDGVLFVPAANRITALQVALMGDPFFDTAANNDSAMVSPGRPLLRFAVRKGRTSGDDTAYWATHIDPAGEYPASFASAFPYETATPWNSNDSVRNDFINEADCGVEIIQANGPTWDVEIEKTEWFAVGVRLKSTDELTASGPVASSRFTIRQNRNHKVVCMLCTDIDVAGQSYWCNGNTIDFLAGRSASGERVANIPLYGIMLTAMGDNYHRPNGNQFLGGMGQGWTTMNSGTTESACILMDRASGNIFNDFRHEHGGANSVRSVIMVNPDELNQKNYIYYSGYSTPSSVDIHNQRDNPIIRRGPYDLPCVPMAEGLTPIAEFNANECMYSGATKILLPKPFLANNTSGSGTFASYLPLAAADVTTVNRLNIDSNGTTFWCANAGQTRLGLMLQIDAIDPWNQIAVYSDIAGRVRMHAFDSSKVLIDPEVTPWARSHTGEFVILNPDGYASPNETPVYQKFSLVSTASSVAYVFVGFERTNQDIKWIKFFMEGIRAEPLDLHAKRRMLELYPLAGYLNAGDTFFVKGRGLYECTTAGYITNGAWANSTAMTKNEYRTNGGNVYRAATSGTSNGTSPTDDVGVTWVLVAAGSAGVISPAGYSTAATDPTTTQLPKDKDWGVHKNSSSGDVFLAYNNGGAILKVELT